MDYVLNNNQPSIIADSFENDAANTNSMKKELGRFISSSYSKNKLMGLHWNAVRTKMQEFDDVLSLREKCIVDLSDTINSAINHIDNCINSYDGEIPIPGKIDFAYEISTADNMLRTYGEKLDMLSKEYESAKYYENATPEKRKNMTAGRSTSEIRSDVIFASSEYKKYLKYLNFMRELLAVYNYEKANLERTMITLDTLSSTVNRLTPSSVIKSNV